MRKTETFSSLFRILSKSASIYYLYLSQIIVVIFIATLISALAVYPIIGKLTIFIKKGEVIDSLNPFMILLSAIILILNQVLFTTLISYIVLFKPQNILKEIGKIPIFIKGKFLKLCLACLAKSLIAGFILLVHPFLGFIVIAMLPMVEFIILLEDKGAFSAVSRNFAVIKSLMFELVLFIALIYAIPLMVLKSALHFAVQALYIINMLILYLKIRDKEN